MKSLVAFLWLWTSPTVWFNKNLFIFGFPITYLQQVLLQWQLSDTQPKYLDDSIRSVFFIFPSWGEVF